jgi:hypothetical protein
MASYQRNQAIAYALRYGIDPNPDYAYIADNDCTNFISQCLRAGGARNHYHPTHPWWYADGSMSGSWSVAAMLYWYILVSTENQQGITAMTFYQSTDEPLSRQITDTIVLGDLIQYRDGDGQVRHSTIITGFSAQGGEPTVTQHTRNAVNLPWRKAFPTAIFHHITGVY